MTTQGKKVGGVLDNFLRVERPIVALEKEKTILFNMRINKRLRDDFKRMCALNNKNMTDEITQFIFDQLESFSEFGKMVKQKGEETTPFNFRISEKLRDDFHRACSEHGTDATTMITQFIRRQVQNA